MANNAAKDSYKLVALVVSFMQTGLCGWALLCIPVQYLTIKDSCGFVNLRRTLNTTNTFNQLKQMNAVQNFNSLRAPRMSDAFPHAVIANGVIYLSGTPGFDPATGQVISTDFEAQVRQVFKNIQVILEDAGSSLSKVVKTTVFMVMGNDFGVLNKVYKEFFPVNPPARSTPQVMPFPAGILVSVECVALL